MLMLRRAILAVLFTPFLSHSINAAVVEDWGLNDSYELGNGNFTNSNRPVVVIGLSSGVTSIARGAYFGMAIQNSGVYAWGTGGIAGTSWGSTAVAVTGLPSGVTAIAGGGYHSLMIQNGAVYAWGSNTYGQLGNGTTTSSTTPVAVNGLSTGVTVIAGGGEYSLAIQNGGVFTWGANYSSGNGTTTYSSTPLAVNGLSNGVTTIAAGFSHSMAIRNGAVYAWGSNTYGQLGNGTTTDSVIQVPVTGLSKGVTAIACGNDHSLAVQNGGVYAWGDNLRGDLGNGTTTNTDLPVQVDPTDLKNIAAVTANSLSSYALSSDGTIWDWGSNQYGELGLGTTISDYLTPQHLVPPTGYLFTSVSANADGYSVAATLTPVPEPASISLLALGAVVSLRRRRAV